MAKLAKFLDKYDTVVFDMDGVVTSEQKYWTAAALTVWEKLFSSDYSVEQMAYNSLTIRKNVFCDDRIITLLKKKGVNSNWDLAYVVYAVSKIYNTTNFHEIFELCSNFGKNILDEYPVIDKALTKATGVDGSRNGILWNDLMMTFQSWYLGDELYQTTYNREPVNKGKTGLISDEKPVIDIDDLISVFKLLSNTNKRLAIATGRPSAELITPIKNFGIYDCFAKDGIITYDHVQEVESMFGKTYSKPHPYVFLKAMLGEDYSDNDIINGEYNHSLSRKTLIVGDAGADMFAAKEMCADFCAVLTGVEGQGSRAYFESNNAEYILDSIEDFIE
ncbi:MAG: HAD family hydrolase [Eubacteriales bacterium]|nr:HAD family hydrolase [Eubacteriales bacterium]